VKVISSSIDLQIIKLTYNTCPKSYSSKEVTNRFNSYRIKSLKTIRV
jgi:hypothetical protein